MTRKHLLAAASFLLLAAPLPAQTAPAPSSAQTDEVARTVEAIAKIRSAGSPSFSPDGKRLAYVSNASGIPQVWVMDVASGEARQLTNLPDPVQSVHWSPSGDWLAYDPPSIPRFGTHMKVLPRSRPPLIRNRNGFDRFVPEPGNRPI